MVSGGSILLNVWSKLPDILRPAKVGHPQDLYSPQFGAFNPVLGAFGIVPIPWVNSPAFALHSLVIADAWQWTPFMFAIILAGLLTSPTEVIEAAWIDGATWLQALWWIELPLLQPILIVAVLLRLIDSIKNLD